MSKNKRQAWRTEFCFLLLRRCCLLTLQLAVTLPGNSKSKLAQSLMTTQVFVISFPLMHTLSSAAACAPIANFVFFFLGHLLPSVQKKDVHVAPSWECLGLGGMRRCARRSEQASTSLRLSLLFISTQKRQIYTQSQKLCSECFAPTAIGDLGGDALGIRHHVSTAFTRSPLHGA